MEVVSDAPIRSEALGYMRRIMLAQSNDPKIREDSQDGAVVTALLMHALDSKVFDCAIVSQPDPECPIKPEPTVALTSEDVAASVGSRFFPSAVIKAYGSAVTEYSKKNIAVVGLPCHVLALRKIDAWRHKIGGKAKLVIGLFCLGAFSPKPFLDHVEEKYGIASDEIEKMYLTHDVTLHTKRGEIGVPQIEAKKYNPLGCKTCIDYTAEVADISIGSAYPLKEWSIVIIRTKAGEKLFDAAVAAKVINARNIEKEPDVFEHVIIAALQKRTEGLIKTSKLEKTHDFVPVRLLRETESLADVKVEEIMSTEVLTVPSTMTVNDLLMIMATKTYIGYPVIDENGELLGVVTMEEVTNVEKADRWNTTVGSIARLNLDVCYPGETALDALKKMSRQETGRVLVLDPANPKKLLGIVTKRDLMHVLVKQASESVH